jgi:phage terminase large subunit
VLDSHADRAGTLDHDRHHDHVDPQLLQQTSMTQAEAHQTQTILNIDPITGKRAMDIQLGKKFAETLWTPARHKALYGGRGSAKSWSVATYLCVETGKTNKRVVCARQYQNSIRDSSKELIEKRIHHLGMDRQFDIQEQEIIHKGTRSKFTFAGLERNIESIRSLEGADIVWIEEARTTKAKSLEVLLPTVRAKGSQFIWTWNPEEPTDPVDSYFRGNNIEAGKSFAPPPNSIITEVSFRDNPYFYETELFAEMEVMKRGNPDRYQHVWEGGYDLRSETKVFPHVKIGRIVIDPDTMYPRYGMDFGFGNDPSFVVKLYINDFRKQIYFAAEATGRVSMDELPNLVRTVVDSDRDLVRCDSSQPGTIEFLVRRGINAVAAKKGPGSVKSGINFLQGYTLIIDPACEQLREEARLYSWATDRLTRKILPIPVDANNHGWDASRYAVEDLSLEGGDADSDSRGGVYYLFNRKRRA